MKKVYKYTIDNTLVGTFNSQTEAAISISRDEKAIREAIKSSTLYKGFYWSNEERVNNAKILFLDIETSPLKVYTFGTKDIYVRPIQIIDDWKVLCWSAKWLGSNEMMNQTITNVEDDFEVVEAIWNLLDECDIAVGHNLDRFDVKKLNARFIQHGLTPPSPYKTFDTLKAARKEFSFTYNNLDFLSKTFGSGGKYKHEGFNLWKRCLSGDDRALEEMQKYCDIDVWELEKVYISLRAWSTNHPSVSIYNEDSSLTCTKCNSKNIKYIKDTYTNTRKYKLYKCNDCNSWNRSRTFENKETLK